MALKIKRGKPRPPAKDRKIMLLVMGALDILGGLLVALIIPLTVFGYLAGRSTAVPPAHPMTLESLIGIGSVYFVLAALAIWAGVGLCLCRRWARSLVLAVSWSCFVFGLLAAIIMVFFMPDIFGTLAGQPGISPGTLTAIKWFTITLLLTLFVLIPGIHVLVLGHPNVRDTCLYRDPRIRWTDAVPLPILILVLYKAFGALSMIQILTHPVAPFFGLLLTGIPAMAVAVGGAAALLWVMREIYFLRIRGWWASLAMTACWSLSYLVTLSRHSLLEMSGTTNRSPEELAKLAQSPIYQGNWLTYVLVAMLLINLSYVIFCKRYFLGKKRARRRAA
jgi:hypothetical protein